MIFFPLIHIILLLWPDAQSYFELNASSPSSLSISICCKILSRLLLICDNECLLYWWADHSIKVLFWIFLSKDILCFHLFLDLHHLLHEWDEFFALNLHKLTDLYLILKQNTAIFSMHNSFCICIPFCDKDISKTHFFEGARLYFLCISKRDSQDRIFSRKKWLGSFGSIDTRFCCETYTYGSGRLSRMKSMGFYKMVAGELASLLIDLMIVFDFIYFQSSHPF